MDVAISISGIMSPDVTLTLASLKSLTLKIRVYPLELFCFNVKVEPRPVPVAKRKEKVQWMEGEGIDKMEGMMRGGIEMER